MVSELSQNMPERIETVIILFEDKISYPYKGRVISLRVPLTANMFLGACYFFLRLYRFKKVLLRERPDYVISLGASPNLISLLAGIRPIVRVDMFISEGRKGLKGWIFKFLLRRLAHRAMKIIAVSRAIAKDMVRTFGMAPENVQVIYNPLDIAKAERLSKEPLLKQYQDIFQHPVIITMGRLKPQKGQEYLIRAFAKVKKTMPTAKLVLLGEGPLREPLEELAKQFSLQKDIHFLGWQDNPFSFLLRAKMFVLSSLCEGLPDVLLEAMACQLPIVSFDCRSGPREIIAPLTDYDIEASAMEVTEYGILVPVRDEDILAAAIIKVGSDRAFAEKIGRNARKRAEDFSIKHLIKEWDVLLQ